MSYIVNAAGTELIAKVGRTLPSGLTVQYAWDKTKEKINADREFNLVNARQGKISNAVKWGKDSVLHAHMDKNDGLIMSGYELNEREFFIA